LKQLGVVAAALGLLLTGCPKEEAPASNDRLLKKLQAEKDRLDQGGAAPKPMAPPVAEPTPLAARAAMPDVPKLLAVTNVPGFSCGPAACQVSSIETSHHLAGEKMSLTSDDYFFKVTLAVQHARGGPMDFGLSKLVAGSEEFPIAKDAQRLAGTRELARSFKPGEKADVVLLFEAPGAATAAGLTLFVAGGDGVPLQ